VIDERSINIRVNRYNDVLREEYATWAGSCSKIASEMLAAIAVTREKELEIALQIPQGVDHKPPYIDGHLFWQSTSATYQKMDEVIL
jgi:hypothetical protein